MPDSNDGAVCVTCDGSGRIVVDRSADGVAIDAACRHCNGTGRIPAPVVPSDERRQCWEVFSTTAIGASVIKWHCKLEKGHDGDHMGAQIHAAAPPTHSQDAEGDGRKALLLQVKGMTGREPVGMGDLLNILTHPDCIEFTEAWLESAIRAPYEELVKAAREPHELHLCSERDCEAYATWWVFDGESSDWKCERHANERPDWWDDSEDGEWAVTYEPDVAAIRLVAALESLGGRS